MLIPDYIWEDLSMDFIFVLPKTHRHIDSLLVVLEKCPILSLARKLLMLDLWLHYS